MDFVSLGSIATLVVGAGALGMGALLIALLYRRVVSTNEVHIVQSARQSVSYGKDTGNGNSYYEWPTFLPKVGVTKVVLPVSNFDIDINDYEAYDEGRLPFIVDIMAFFRIADPTKAAQRVSGPKELPHQLRAVVQGAVRSILASHPIEEIMQGRSKFGSLFTEEVKEQVANWGVESIKNIELMDIRDANGSVVIKNIMEKKKSLIEAESRTAVAQNQRQARLAEIEAKQETDLRDQAAKQAVGEREIAVKLVLNQQQEQAQQQVSEQQRITKEKEMAVQRVGDVQGAEIAKQVQIVVAEQDKQTKVIKATADKDAAVLSAEGEKQTLTLKAEGALEAKKREAEGIKLEGEAKAEAEKALQLAPVQAQIVLAQEIGSNHEYQTYLLTIRRIEAEQAVGMAQADALKEADIKVIATSDNASQGLSSVGDLLTARGGTKIASMLEAVKQTPVGERVINSLLPADHGNGLANGGA